MKNERKKIETSKNASLPKNQYEVSHKLADCNETKTNPQKCEIFIVEGDSAGGSAKTARKRAYQAILPIRGKILNVEKATLDKVFANLEIQTMITTFTTDHKYGEELDTAKLRYGKIVIMADADKNNVPLYSKECDENFVNCWKLLKLNALQHRM